MQLIIKPHSKAVRMLKSSTLNPLTLQRPNPLSRKALTTISRKPYVLSSKPNKPPL